MHAFILYSSSFFLHYKWFMKVRYIIIQSFIIDVPIFSSHSFSKMSFLFALVNSKGESVRYYGPGLISEPVGDKRVAFGRKRAHINRVPYSLWALSSPFAPPTAQDRSRTRAPLYMELGMVQGGAFLPAERVELLELTPTFNNKLWHGVVNISDLDQLVLQTVVVVGRGEGYDVRKEMCLKISEHKILKELVPTQTEHMLLIHGDPQAVQRSYHCPKLCCGLTHLHLAKYHHKFSV